MAEAERRYVKAITSKHEDFSGWYTDVVLRADLADYAPVRGSIVFKPYGYAIWENIQAELDRRFKATGVQNAYFPLLIPESIFRKEAEHIEGFAPEVPWVTHVGDEVLAERYVIRPTSETIIGTMYAKWIQSYRDLPVLINQWCNVLRWERRTYPFLRTSEFLWQEGHTAHRDEADAEARTRLMLEVYRGFVEEFLAIPVIAGQKSELEKFAGAVRTYSVEALMSDGRALQAGTSHYLGDGFARVLGIEYLDADGTRKPVHQTSWGASTRLIGALIMVHGDERGLVLPPRVAPLQAVIVPVGPQKERPRVLEAAASVRDALAGAGVRVHLDDREEYTPGWKFNHWELKGVPVRVEVGPRDLDQGQAVLVRRDTGQKAGAPLEGLTETIRRELDDMQQALFERARQFMRASTREADGPESFRALVAPEGARGLVVGGWCGANDCERAVKDETGFSLRCMPFDEALQATAARRRCIRCGEAATRVAVFARAY